MKNVNEPDASTFSPKKKINVDDQAFNKFDRLIIKETTPKNSKLILKQMSSSEDKINHKINNNNSSILNYFDSNSNKKEIKELNESINSNNASNSLDSSLFIEEKHYSKEKNDSINNKSGNSSKKEKSIDEIKNSKFFECFADKDNPELLYMLGIFNDIKEVDSAFQLTIILLKNDNFKINNEVVQNLIIEAIYNYFDMNLRSYQSLERYLIDFENNNQQEDNLNSSSSYNSNDSNDMKSSTEMNTLKINSQNDTDNNCNRNSIENKLQAIEMLLKERSIIIVSLIDKLIEKAYSNKVEILFSFLKAEILFICFKVGRDEYENSNIIEECTKIYEDLYLRVFEELKDNDITYLKYCISYSLFLADIYQNYSQAIEVANRAISKVSSLNNIFSHEFEYNLNKLESNIALWKIRSI